MRGTELFPPLLHAVGSVSRVSCVLVCMVGARGMVSFDLCSSCSPPPGRSRHHDFSFFRNGYRHFFFFVLDQKALKTSRYKTHPQGLTCNLNKQMSPSLSTTFWPSQDLARLRQSAAATAASSPSSSSPSSSSTCIDAHRRALKQCSDARIAGWADTVEAKWESKLRAKQLRLEAAEKERERVDEEEAELERVETQATLARAKALLFEQSDAFKSFRSAQRYADILQVRTWARLIFVCFPLLLPCTASPLVRSTVLSLLWTLSSRDVNQ